MKKIIIVVTLLLGSGLMVYGDTGEEDTVCVKPFFEDTRNLSKEDLVCFLEGDQILLQTYIVPKKYAHTLKAFNRKNKILISNPVSYVKEMKDTFLMCINLEVSMASRGCGDETYYFRTTLNGYHRVFMYQGVPKILAKGGYIIELFDENSFDAYYEVYGRRQYITLTTPENHRVHQGDSVSN